jgi:hypothetical protein
MMYHHYLCRLQQDVYDSIGEDAVEKPKVDADGKEG